MQWYRRTKELELSQADIDEYFDECIAKRWEPSLFGLWKYKEPSGNDNPEPERCKCPNCGNEHRRFLP